MYIIKHRMFFFVLSSLLILASLTAYFGFKKNYSIEFTGGALLELSYPQAPNVDAVKAAVAKLNLGEASVQSAGDSDVLIRTKDLDNDQYLSLVKAASLDQKTTVKQFNSYGPSIGAELKQNSIWAIVAVIIGIVLYVAYAFRQVSKPVSSWIYGLVTVIALAHDVIIPAGVYAYLSHLHPMQIQIDVLFVTAILTVLGFSVHDTIVVFDRTRENLRHDTGKNFEETVGMSISQTFTRSINTSLTVLLVVGALFLVGGETTKWFAFTLGIGIIVGTYSSIFIASPLLVSIANHLEKGKGKKKR